MEIGGLRRGNVLTSNQTLKTSVCDASSMKLKGQNGGNTLDRADGVVGTQKLILQPPAMSTGPQRQRIPRNGPIHYVPRAADGTKIQGSRFLVPIMIEENDLCGSGPCNTQYRGGQPIQNSGEPTVIEESPPFSKAERRDRTPVKTNVCNDRGLNSDMRHIFQRKQRSSSAKEDNDMIAEDNYEPGTTVLNTGRRVESKLLN